MYKSFLLTQSHLKNPPGLCTYLNPDEKKVYAYNYDLNLISDTDIDDIVFYLQVGCLFCFTWFCLVVINRLQWNHFMLSSIVNVFLVTCLFVEKVSNCCVFNKNVFIILKKEPGEGSKCNQNSEVWINLRSKWCTLKYLIIRFV